jgi:hypothetical protein
MRFHLPAYLIADLRGEYQAGMAFILTQAQRTAVRLFLKFIESDPDYQWDQPHIVSALSGYWAEQA